MGGRSERVGLLGPFGLCIVCRFLNPSGFGGRAHALDSVPPACPFYPFCPSPFKDPNDATTTGATQAPRGVGRERERERMEWKEVLMMMSEPRFGDVGFSRHLCLPLLPPPSPSPPFISHIVSIMQIDPAHAVSQHPFMCLISGASLSFLLLLFFPKFTLAPRISHRIFCNFSFVVPIHYVLVTICWSSAVGTTALETTTLLTHGLIKFFKSSLWILSGLDMNR